MQTQHAVGGVRIQSSIRSAMSESSRADRIRPGSFFRAQYRRCRRPIDRKRGSDSLGRSHRARAGLHSSVDEVMAMAYHILVVEDEPDTRELLDFTLRWNGHHVDTASNGREALELARRA